MDKSENLNDFGVYKLVGLSKANKDIVATCELLDREETFQAKIKMAKNQKEGLWKYCENFWEEKKVAKVEYDSLNESGIPINARVTAIWNS